MAYQVFQHKLVSKKHIPKLKKANLLCTYEKVLDQLAKNPFARVYNMEVLEPRNKKPRVFSMRINSQHRVVYTVDKNKKSFAFIVHGHIMNPAAEK